MAGVESPRIPYNYNSNTLDTEGYTLPIVSMLGNALVEAEVGAVEVVGLVWVSPIRMARGSDTIPLFQRHFPLVIY